MRRWLRDKLDLLLGEWNIGFACQNVADVIAGEPLNVEWLIHDYTDRWFADPFLLSEDKDNWYLLAEEMVEGTDKGVIVELTVDKEHVELIGRRVVLEEDCHLSFPYIYNKGGRTFVMPEKGRSGSWSLYAYDAESHSCTKSATQEGLSVADAILADCNTMLATKADNPNGNELSVFNLNSESWQQTCNIVFKENIARNAGRIINVGNATYRPAQVCNRSYGEAVSLQRMTCKDGKTALEEVVRLSPTDKVYSHGLHTFNVYNNGNLIIVDGLRYNFRKVPRRLSGKLQRC